MSRERKVLVYKDNAGEYRWQVKAGNGEIIAVSGEGYKNKAHARSMAESLHPGVEIVEETE